MGIGRKLKRTKEREESEKSRREAEQRAANADKVREYFHLMAQAFNAKDFATALQWALKLLKIAPSDRKTFDIAITCADLLHDNDTLYGLLKHGWQRQFLTGPPDHLTLGSMAMEREELEFARAVFQNMVQHHREMFSWISKKHIKAASTYLHECEARLTRAKLSAALDKLAARSSDPKQSPAVAATPTETAAAPGREPPPEEALPRLKVAFKLDETLLLQAVEKHSRSDYQTFQLALDGYRLSFRSSYDQLICLPSLRHVRSLWYQEETARKVMRTFRGRAILADEVGLGKTIEAGLILKEYVMRGLVRSALILTPSSLVHQWQEEMAEKFGLDFISSNDALCRQDPESFWSQPFIIASIHTAKTKRHFDSVTKRSYEMVIVDEAHHLKNRTTLNWKLVNSIQKTFLLMLTATPVQNSLEELYNLVTLLRPGHLKTLNAFKEEYVTRGNPTDPQNREKLKGLLKEVMVRNTRSVTQLQLPPRYAYTIRIAPTVEEEHFYSSISRLVVDQSSRLKGPALLRLRKLLEAAGSSHAAALRLLENTEPTAWNGAGEAVAEIVAVGKRIAPGNKTLRVIELLRASPQQKIVFVNHTATLDHLRQVLEKEQIQHVTFHGSLSPTQKQAAIAAFEQGCQVLLATGTGGEGFNLQFCQTMINFDLPWNPMAIEQRIGRIHRIGQEKEVHIYNFCAAGSIEDHILEVLDRKINMFELVVGEIDMILGRLRGEEEFSDMVYEIWLQHPDEAERQKAFAALAAKLKRAQSAHEKSKELDEKLFQEDFGT